MNKLFQSRHIVKDNLMLLIGVCLCFYFSYHLLLGERSLVRYVALGNQIESMSHNESIVRTDRERLERKVVMMRPGSINRDLLGERVRLVLGYRHKDEVIVLGN